MSGLNKVTQKAPDAFRTISEAAEELDLPQHVLRHWEETFGAIRPMRRAGGRRFYRLSDIELIAGVKALLHGERFTTKGVQKIFKEQGNGFVVEIGKKVLAGTTPDEAYALIQPASESSSSASNGSVSISTEKLQRILKDLKLLKTEIGRLRRVMNSQA